MTVSIYEHEFVVSERDALRMEVDALRREAGLIIAEQSRNITKALRKQLAVSQAREQQANECRIALVHQIHELADHIERSEYCINDIDMLKQMRGQRSHAMSVASQWNQNGNPFSTDTTALEAMITKAGEVMRERAVVASGNVYSMVEIRALPAVTLDDLKGGA